MNIGDIDVGLVLAQAPTEEPLALGDAKTHLGIDQSFTDDDDYITDLVVLARQHTESILRRALLDQSWRLSLRQWPGRDYANWPTSVTMDVDAYYKYNFIKLPFPPLQSVTSVTYFTSSGQMLTMPPKYVIGGSAPVLNPNYNSSLINAYNVYTDMEPGRIVLDYANVWPTDILMPGAPIQITYVCGYPDVETLQSTFEAYTPTMRAIKEIVGYAYEYRIPPSEMRRSSVPAGIQMVVEELLVPYRVYD